MLTSSLPSAAAALTLAAKAVKTCLTASAAAGSTAGSVQPSSSISAAHSSSHRLASRSVSETPVGSCCSRALVAFDAATGVAADVLHNASADTEAGTRGSAGTA